MEHKNAKKPIRLFVFDLDSTLWDGRRLYPDVIEILQHLRNRGHLIYLSSFNVFAPQILQYLKIKHYFHGGVYGLNTTKTQHILEIKQKIKNKVRCDIRFQIDFFDDKLENVQDVAKQSNNAVRAVQAIDGMNWRLLDKKDRKVRFDLFQS